MIKNGSKWWFPTIISKKKIHTIQFKVVVFTCWVSVQNWFAFRPRWPNFGPLVAKKWLKMVVSDHYLKKYSHNPIQTWYLHLLGDCSELICFLATLAKFWPSSGHKITENGGPSGGHLCISIPPDKATGGDVHSLMPCCFRFELIFGHWFTNGSVYIYLYKCMQLSAIMTRPSVSFVKI